MISSPAVFTDADYTPHAYDCAYPIYEVHPVEELEPGFFQQKRFYRRDMHSVAVLEMVNVDDRGEVLSVVQRLYEESRKDLPNWKIFDPQGILGTAEMRYDSSQEMIEDGQYMMHYRDGSRIELKYKDGLPNGETKKYYPDGSLEEAIYAAGKKQGIMKFYAANGVTEECFYVDNVLHGDAVKEHPDGYVERYRYENGMKQGLSKCVSPKEENFISNYVDGVRKGRAYQENPDGSMYGYWYVGGKIEGLTCLVDRYDCVINYLVFVANEKIYEFAPDKELPKSFDRTLKDMTVPARDIKTLYDEVLKTMMQQNVKEDTIIDMGLRLQPLMARQG